MKPTLPAPVRKAPPGKLPGKVPPAPSVTPRNPTTSRAAMTISPPKLTDIPAASLPKLGNRFVAVRVSVPIPSNARQSRKIVERNAANGGANVNAAKASVILFDPKHLDELRNVRSNLTSMLDEIGLKTNDGYYVVHASRSKTLLEMGVAAEKAYKDCARQFVDNYEQYCEDWSANLGEDYDPKLYPPIEKIAAQLGMGGSSKRRGFSFAMTMVSEHDDGLETNMGLSLTDDEREFVAQGARAHYQNIVDQAFEQLRDAMEKIVDGDQKGRRVRKNTVDHAYNLAAKIEDMGIDTNGVAARARSLTAKHAPVRSKDDKGRDAYTARAKAILSDLDALASGNGGE